VTSDEVIAIVGATATGKTALAIEVARRVGGEIISMDSRQVYRGLDIGTAKPTVAQQRVVPHFGVDLIDPTDRYSAGRFARDARNWIDQIRGRGQVPILVGGTGFFLKALTDPLFAEPELSPTRREQLKRYLATKSETELRDWLQVSDAGAARRHGERGDRQRMARALEVVLLTGRTLGWWHEHAQPAAPGLRPLCFVLELPRDELYRRINTRVEEMIEQGLVEEVRGLVGQGFDERAPGMKTTGYLELLPYLRGEIDLATAVDAIQRASRRYARRQNTWFRHQLPNDTIRLDAGEPLEQLVARVTAQWEVCSADRD
jgi:tRNA dimethylallyltransferase